MLAHAAANPPPLPDTSLVAVVVAKKRGAVKTNFEDNNFVSATKFTGSQKGYVFTKGKLGLGYYKDDEAPVVATKDYFLFMAGVKVPRTVTHVRIRRVVECNSTNIRVCYLWCEIPLGSIPC